MKNLFMRAVYAIVEKLKHTGGIRMKLKAAFSPCYRLFCRILWYRGTLYLYHVELPVTLKCSLKCAKCGFLMPYFQNPVDYPAKDLLLYMDKLFDCVDTIQIFRILGGEPFLYRDLEAVIRKALSSDKVKTVDIVTNGTIVPNDKILSAMKNPRLTVQISDYGKYSRKKEELKAACDKAGVKCVIRGSKEKTWIDPGGLEYRGRTVKQMKKQMRHCGNICRNFHNGKLYYCPRASFGTKLGIPDAERDYVDFTKGLNREELRKEIFELNQRKYLIACNYCSEGTKEAVEIPVAEQM